MLEDRIRQQADLCLCGRKRDAALSVGFGYDFFCSVFLLRESFYHIIINLCTGGWLGAIQQPARQRRRS